MGIPRNCSLHLKVENGEDQAEAVQNTADFIRRNSPSQTRSTPRYINPFFTRWKIPTQACASWRTSPCVNLLYRTDHKSPPISSLQSDINLHSSSQGSQNQLQGSASNTDEKKDSVQIIAGKCDEQTRKPNTDSGQGEGATNGQTHSVSEHPEPPFKQLCDNGLNEPGEESAERQTPQFQPTKTNAASSSDLEEKESSSAHLGEESVDQNRAAEVQGVGTSLKVTIQRSNESRAFNTSPEEMAAASAVHEKERGKHTDQFTCHICNSTCTGQHGFQTHMMSQDHQQRMMEIQRLGNNCLATFIPQSHESLPGTNREKTVNLQHWCPTCQCRFSGDVIEHRRTKKHKMAKVSSRPFCTLCDRHFRTPRKFVEHMKSPQHKQRVEEINHEGEVMDELITVDAIGCFEGEDDYEEDRNEERVPVVEKHSIQKEATMEETTDYDPDVQYGTSFVVPVAGFLCKLCHKFYHFESSARETHCRSLVHFQNLQKHNNLNMQKVETQGDGGRDV
ncbi:hypothetical protein DNTS_021180 [Danionella cerebrum]|uniref:Matrin-type domain-containing protein n=1 Tax=Danionella cerebrum TaxID=2873325 RepID=A0A553RA67_9TELE|nr:hypothetical protein DNTS_021180 [Danionella translucida]